MVYYGRPSKACLPCRRRKLRCDLAAAGCGQCRRAGLQCSGYRDTNDLLFYDQSQATEQKVRARQVWCATPHAATELPWDTRARYAFLSIYVSGFSQSCDAVTLFYDRAKPSSTLSKCLDTMSLAFLATQLNHPGLMTLACRCYISAIRSLGQTISEPTSSHMEETIQAILLLDMYEKIVSANPYSSATWMTHLQGGCALLLTRGNEILSSPIGCKLASRLAMLLTASCAAATVPIPSALEKLNKELGSLEGNPKWKFINLMARIADLQADIRRTGGSIDVAIKAQQLDDQLKTLQMSLPLSWRPRVVIIKKPDKRVFNRYYDLYLDHYITQVSNGIRAMRLILIDIIRNHTPEILPSFEKNLRRELQSVTREICASVPQFILAEAQPDNMEPFSPRQRLQCYALLAPLYIAGQVSDDSQMHNWISWVLRYMAEAGQIRIAKKVADLAVAGYGLSYWSVWAMSGSYVLAA